MPPENPIPQAVHDNAPARVGQKKKPRLKTQKARKDISASEKTANQSSIPSGPIALVGLMGVGKTTIGRRLAKELGRPFYDSDDEIEKASGRTVAGYFRDHGETAFRAGELRVIERLLSENQDIILATGGGAFIEPETRKILNEKALTVFLKGDFETIFTRVRKKDTRPLLKVENPRQRFKELYDERYPIYAQAHITVEIAKGPHTRTVKRVSKAILSNPLKSTA